ncbi:MAG: aldehyde dehydrogenase family protein, partial [Acidimicrobiia bacterium]
MHVPLLINGERVEAKERIEVRNPARPAEVVGTVGAATADDVDKAVAAAHRAFPAWRDTPLPDRLAAFAKAAEVGGALPPELAETLTREMGKIALEAGADMSFAQLAFVQAMETGPPVLEPAELRDDFGLVTLERVPRGVAALVVAWNWPPLLAFVKLAPALLGGNTVVLLSSPYAPLAVSAAVSEIASVFPPGVINVITGHGPEAGAALCSHPLVHTVSFTGGIETGGEVMKLMAGTIKAPILELGGNDPAILLDDTEITEELIRALLVGAFMTTGQVCIAIKRLYVARNLYQSVVDGLVAGAGQMVVGDGLAEGTTMGPMANGRQLARFQGFIEEAKAAGATVVETGTLTADPGDGGHFHRPVIVTGADHKTSIVACEQFGPGLPVIPFDTVDEAVSLANDSEFGLMSSVWSSDPSRAWQVARRVESGTTFINQHSLFSVDLRSPAGGVKQSGIG